MNSKSKVEGLTYGWDGKDWQRYKWTMRATFREHDLLNITGDKLTRERLRSEESKARFDKNQFMIMQMIGMMIPPQRFQRVDHYEPGTEMWEALCEIYEKRQNTIIRESTILRLSEEFKSYGSGDVQAHVTHMFRLKTALASYGFEMNTVNMKTMLQDSLSDQCEFEQLRGAVKYGRNSGTLIKGTP
ncbi:hypothetical protein P3T76_012184 [Phytophthora citrophthora]|uniref:Uncharacterized protein n=1 Tax=Phytophthora citrophthora TaxID=4793 RepID=A0AAD9LDM6_9STRA|nr:hypothetical protein P3T76_012184 [Phytophthora citrophthora]